MADTFVEIMINHFTFTREGVRTCGPEAVLTHHLCLGVAMAGVQAVGATSHRLAWPHWGEAENLSRVVRAQRLAHAPDTHISPLSSFRQVFKEGLLCLFYFSPCLSRLLAPLASLALMIQTLAWTLPDTSETRKLVIYQKKSQCSLCPCGHWLIEADVREAIPSSS